MSDARHGLLARLIDYAGLFPPAQLPMVESLEGYYKACEGPFSWMLDRFICPASRLDELTSLAGRRLRVSVVADTGLPLPFIKGVDVELVEVRLAGTSLEEIARLEGPRVFVEVAPDESLEANLDELAALGVGAKVRCGGEAFPSPEELARFVSGCAARGLRFKATAGLHHPFRDPSRHGFLNLLAAAGLASEGQDPTEVLADEDRANFELDAAGLRWRGRDVGTRARELLVAYGSCSFEEPVEDLMVLGMLDVEVAA